MAARLLASLMGGQAPAAVRVVPPLLVLSKSSPLSWKQTDRDVEWRLHEAAKRGDLTTLQELLERDADPNWLKKFGIGLLLTAIHHDDESMVAYLLEADAAIVTQHRRGLFLSALRHSNVAVVARLARDGLGDLSEAGAEPLVLCAVKQKLKAMANVRAVENASTSTGFFSRRSSSSLGGTAILKPQRAEKVIECLLHHGADANALGENGDTALHVATRESAGASLVLLLLRYGAVPSLKIRNQSGLDPLHEAVQASNTEAVKVLLHAGADCTSETQTGKTPLELAVFSETMSSTHIYTIALALVAHGHATWDSGCAKHLASLPQENPRLNENLFRESYPRRGRRQSDGYSFPHGMRVCVEQWIRDVARGLPCKEIPIEVVQRGNHATKTYMAYLNDGFEFRRKLCVVGPSGWGKTSLVRSLITRTPSLVHAHERTIGIDLMGDEFVDSQLRQAVKHTVTYWDFAGQDIYQVAHALFFSRRTLYLVCVNLEAYAQALQDAQAQSSLRNGEILMQRFASKTILQWLRLIFVRQPDAEFVVVGTKLDQLAATPSVTVEAIWNDLRRRVEEWKRSLLVEINEADRNVSDSSQPSPYPPIGSIFVRLGNQSDKSHLQELRDRVDTILSGKWLAVSAVNVDEILAARAQLKQTILSSGRSFAMPAMYARVLAAIHSRRQETAKLSPKERVERMIVPSNVLCQSLVQSVQDLTVEECQSILRTLCDIGDVLWYEHEDAGVLQDCVILDPLIVLDLVREVINHNHIDEGGESCNDGRVTHDRLKSMPLWKHLDAELSLAFKGLLQYFQLAYPADNQSIDWDSDLIVPAYWKARDKAPEAKDVSQLDLTKARIVWEYELSADVSETVFENAAVLSHTPFARRRIGPRRFGATDEKAHIVVQMSLNPAESLHREVFRIDAQSQTGDTEAAWSYLRFYVMTIEYVLEAYPGLTASRYVTSVHPRDKTPTRHRVNDVIKACADAAIMSKNGSELRAVLSWLPQGDLTWFVEKAWRRPTMLHELRIHASIDVITRKMDVLQKLVAADKSRRLYPALWTLEYGKADVTLRMLSDVSGICYHVPIRIKLAHSFWKKYGLSIQRGLTIFSTVVPDAISFGIVNNVAQLAASAVESKTERAIQVHSAIEKLEATASENGSTKANTKLSTRGSVDLLRDLLLVHDPAFHEYQIPRLSNLQCATTADGAFVWAHRDEVVELSNALTACDSPSDSIAVNKNEIDDAQNLTTLQLRIIDIDGIAPRDWRKLFCEWQIVRSGNRQPIASGITPQQPSDQESWKWGSHVFAIASTTSLASLRDCRLIVRVKRPSRCPGIVRLISQGSASLDSLAETSENRSVSKGIRVVLHDTSASARSTQPPRWVSCEISPTRAPPA